MGSGSSKLAFGGRPPTVILLAGLQGSGKTTAAAKLALLLRKEKRVPGLIAADLQRPAAIDQLEQLGRQIQGPVYREDTTDPVQAKPTNVLLVLDAMTGQEAVSVAQAFQERVAFDGVILTKLDGDARGGAALSVKAVTGKPIKLASVGEKREQLEQRMMKGQFTFDDFLKSYKMLRRMGPLQGVLKLIPGLGKQLEGLDQEDEKQLPRVEANVLSMTPQERQLPRLIDGRRRLRIARGSGTTVQQVNQLLEARKQMEKMMKGMSKGKMPSLPGLTEAAANGGPGSAPARARSKSKKKKKKRSRSRR